MKSIKILLALCFIGLLTSSRPAYNNSNEFLSFKSVTDLSGDDVFVSTVNDLLAIQGKVFAAKSEKLLIRNAEGTLTEAEKNTLAVNLGYADYAAMNNSLFGIGSSILALKNKYTELNNEATSASVIKFSIDRMQQLGKISNAVSINTHECFKQLYASIVACIKNSQTRPQFILCLQVAYAQFNVCIHQ